MSAAQDANLNETARLAKLYRLALLDSPAEPAFDRLAGLAATFVQAPVALISLLDADRQFFKSCIGLAEPWATLRQTPLSYSYCQHAVASREPLIIADARDHPLVSDSPAIVDLQAVAYLGIPLITSDGYALGTLCVIDAVPRTWTADEIAVMRDLAAAVVTELELRIDVIARREAETAALDQMRRFRQLAQNSPDIIYIVDVQAWRMVYLNRDDLLGYSQAELESPGSIIAALHPADRARVKAHWAEVLAGSVSAIDYRLCSKQGIWEWLHSRATIVARTADGAPLEVLVTLTLISERKAIDAHLQLLESVVVSASDAVVVTEAEPINLPGPRIVYVNKAFTAMTGYEAAEVLGETPRILQGPDTSRATLDQLRAALERWQPTRVELINYRKDGTSFWIEISVVPVADATGWYTHWIAIQRDITARKQAELLDRDRTRVLESIAQHEPLPIVLDQLCLLIERQRPGVLASVLLMAGARLYDGAGPSLPSDYRAAINGIAVGPEVGSCGAAAALRAPTIVSDITADPRWDDYRELALAHNLRACWSAPILDSSGAVLGTFALYYRAPAQAQPHDLVLLTMVSQLAAIAIEQQQLAARLTHQAYHDELTGLPNRALFHDRLTQALTQAKRQRRSVAVLFIDLDRFKPINDTLGHQIGDRVLQQVAQRFREHLRASDTLARISGDEFTVILPQSDSPQDAVRIGHKLLATLRQPIRVDDHDIFVSASVGISIAPQDGHTADQLIRQADLAMYRAKTHGRNLVQCFAEEMNTAAQGRLELERDLRRALERGEFQLHYQPRIDLRSGAITGVEALLRWQHRTRGPIPPSLFIPVAEECGQMIALGAWVLREACRQGQLWRRDGRRPLTIAVNVSALQFAQADFVATVRTALANSGFPAGCLELELTESVLMQDLESVVERLRDLRALGVTIAIDDFGTGYSSLAYLQRLPLDRLKIDQAFVRDLPTQLVAEPAGNRAQALVDTIVTLAHNLGLEAVAEGVEQAEQATILRRLGCDQAQGYFFARPLPSAELHDWLEPDAATQTS